MPAAPLELRSTGTRRCAGSVSSGSGRPAGASRLATRFQSTKHLRFAIVGTGFWSRFQLAAWREIPGAECVALFNRTRAKAVSLGREFGITAIYDDVAETLARESLDFININTDMSSHATYTRLAAERGVPAICQKTMCSTLAEAEALVSDSEKRGVPFFVHENFRWQPQIRALAQGFNQGPSGRPFRARIDFISGFPVFDNQPFLADLEQFILTEAGRHTLDVARFLFDEAKSIHCLTQRVHSHIKGEDVATVTLHMHNGMHVSVNMAYASNALEREEDAAGRRRRRREPAARSNPQPSSDSLALSSDAGFTRLDITPVPLPFRESW